MLFLVVRAANRSPFGASVPPQPGRGARGSSTPMAAQGAAAVGAGGGDAEACDGVAGNIEGTSIDVGKGCGKSKGDRLKELVVPLFGAERQVGTFPTRLHSDLRHLV